MWEAIRLFRAPAAGPVPPGDLPPMSPVLCLCLSFAWIYFCIIVVRLAARWPPVWLDEV